MSDTIAKIGYYDLLLEARKGRLPKIVGRNDELQRFSRIISRRLLNNCFLVGPSGIGKTALIHGFARKQEEAPGLVLPVVQLDSESFYLLSATASNAFVSYQEAFLTLPPCVLVIDDFGMLTYNKPLTLQNMVRLLRPLLESRKIRVVISCQPQEYQWICDSEPAFVNQFETLTLKNQDANEHITILEEALRTWPAKPALTVSREVLEAIVKFAEKFNSLGQLPRSALSLLDESIAQARVTKKIALSLEEVCVVLSDKTGVPLGQLEANEFTLLRNLERDLNLAVIGQESPIARISSAIQRAKLGLKNPHRPLGSFLLLGPSGVGKTETARQLATNVFGKKGSFVRLDMSEFAQEHVTARLLGAPPGYVGYDAGGELTDRVKREPYSLVLLDEIEKAHVKVFDIFLQILDDGRLTSARGETVDFTQTIIMATSNLGIREIVAGFANGEDIHGEQFLQKTMLPILTQSFRLEFLNRFDAILVFKPLTEEDLLGIAALEIKKIESRIGGKYGLAFKFDPKVLRQKIAVLADPRFGARPVKRFVEETCETLITKALL